MIPEIGVVFEKYSKKYYITLPDGSQTAMTFEHLEELGIKIQQAVQDEYSKQLQEDFLDDGDWPENQIDHIDQDPSNDAISNLRDVTNEVNSWNKGLHSKNKTGVPGVHISRLGQYVAQIHIKGRTRHIGSFTSLHQARLAREEYLIKHMENK